MEMNRDNRIIDNLYEPLLRGAVAMLHDVDEAMDVVQEVFLFYCTKGDACMGHKTKSTKEKIYFADFQLIM